MSLHQAFLKLYLNFVTTEKILLVVKVKGAWLGITNVIMVACLKFYLTVSKIQTFRTMMVLVSRIINFCCPV